MDRAGDGFDDEPRGGGGRGDLRDGEDAGGELDADVGGGALGCLLYTSRCV